MIAAAEDIAKELEKRYKVIQSKAWEHWCRKSISEGGSKVIRWITAHERGIQAPRQEESSSKMGRIQKQWMDIWGTTPCIPIKVPPAPWDPKLTLTSLSGPTQSPAYFQDGITLPEDPWHQLPPITVYEVQRALK